MTSLDSYRGLVSSLMIIVNYGGGHYHFLNHSIYNGATIADVLFPSFVFISGFSMCHSYHQIINNNDDNNGNSNWYNMTKRALMLYVLNLYVNNGINVTINWRYPGVLFYHSISGIITSLTVIVVRKQTRLRLSSINDRSSSLVTFLSCYLYEYMIQGSLLIITLFLSLGIKLENCPRGYQGPGGLSDNGLYHHCTGGTHRWIDIMIFGENHIYDNPTFKEMYQSYHHFDPEGFLGSLSASSLCYIGLICGRIFFYYKNNKTIQLKVLSRIAIMFIIIGLILTRCSKNDGYINYNKNLWTLSFIIINTSYSIILFIICYILIDYNNIWSGYPLNAVGKHALIIYVISELSIFCKYFSYGSSHIEVLISNIKGAVFFILLSNVLQYFNVNRYIKL